MRATYQPTPDADPIPCEVIEVYKRSVVCREVDRLFPGVFTATRNQVLIEKVGTRWFGVTLEALRRDYETVPYTLPELAARHRTHSGVICTLARKHKWTRHYARRGKIGRLPRGQVLHQAAE